MTETSDDNRFTRMSCECVYDKDDMRVYRGPEIGSVDHLTSITGWCKVEDVPGVVNYKGPLYAVVKILQNGIKIKAGMDVGFGTVRYINDKTLTFEHAKKYIDIIDTIYTDEVLLNIEPKNKDNIPILPDMWHLRHLNDRINKTICKNEKIVQLLYRQKIAFDNIDS